MRYKNVASGDADGSAAKNENSGEDGEHGKDAPDG